MAASCASAGLRPQMAVEDSQSLRLVCVPSNVNEGAEIASVLISVASASRIMYCREDWGPKCPKYQRGTSHDQRNHPQAPNALVSSSR